MIQNTFDYKRSRNWQCYISKTTKCYTTERFENISKLSNNISKGQEQFLVQTTRLDCVAIKVPHEDQILHAFQDCES